jgi:hypothetical protein
MINFSVSKKIKDVIDMQRQGYWNLQIGLTNTAGL